MDIDRTQRQDIDDVSNNRLTLNIDENNTITSSYSINLKDNASINNSNNWIKGSTYIYKNNIAEEDLLIFELDNIIELREKLINNVTISFNYVISYFSSFYPIISSIGFIVDNSTYYSNVEYVLKDSGNISIDCSNFGLDTDVLNTAIKDKGFSISINFNGNKSNTRVSISNPVLKFNFTNKLEDETDAVVNRLEPKVDFYKDENGDIILQIGGDAEGKGMERTPSIDTYSKTEIDNKLASKVNTQTGKGLSTNDFTNSYKNKLNGIENNANNYVHPNTHNTSMIIEPNYLENLETSINATQSEINQAIDSKIVNSGGGSNVDIVTSWESTPSNLKVASEKLTKDSLDEKLNKSLDVSYITVESNDKVLITDYNNSNNIRAVQSILTDHIKDPTAYTNIGTSANATQSSINSAINSILGALTGIELIVVTTDKGSANLSKMNKLYVETKNGKTDVYFVLEDTNGVGTRYTWECIDEDILDSLSIDWSDITNKPSIPSKISDLTNDSNFITTSSTAGLIKNDGSVDTSSYSTFSGNYDDLSNKPSASSTVPSADTANGSYGSGTSYARSNHTHPKSGIYAEASHNHTKSQITDFPSIPSKISDLTNDSNFITTSSTAGLIKNDGSVDTSSHFILTSVTPLSTDNPKKDLNNYLTQGFYTFFNSSNVQNMEQTTLPNGLEHKSFYLLVERRSDSYVKQTLTRADNGKTWIRIKNSSTWSDWSELSITGHTHDDRYYTESEVDTALSNKVSTSDSRLTDARNPIAHHLEPTVDDPIDLNDYKDTGFYYVSNNEVTQYVSHMPTNDNRAFSLLVEAQTGVKQTLTYYVYQDTPRMFVRELHWGGSTWFDWYEVSFDGHTHTVSNITDLDLTDYQELLVSGTNIKTINNQSLLGSGNITIQGSSGGSVIGTGSFSINNQGHLIVELPDAVDNPYFIDNNGHLIYDTSNVYNGE